MEAEAQADAMKTNLKSEDTAGDNPTAESEVPAKVILECLQGESESIDISRVQGILYDAICMIQAVKKKKHDIEAALRRQLQLERDEKIKLETTITDLESQKGTILTEVSHLQAIHKRKLEQSVTINNFIRDEKNRLLTDVQSLRNDKDRLGRDLEATKMNFEEERQRTLCELCMESPKDTVCFPCLHRSACFSYLKKHPKRQKPCPTCAATVKSVLQLA